MTRRRRKHAGARGKPEEATAAIARVRLERLVGRSPRPGTELVTTELLEGPAGAIDDEPVSDFAKPVDLTNQFSTPAQGSWVSRVVAGLPGRLADHLPPSLRAARLAPGGRALAGLAVVAAAGLLLGIALLWLARPAVQAAPPPTPARLTRVSSSVTSVTSVSRLVVHVAGAVRRPGLVELAPHARVADALAAAGGPARNAELASVNLARPVVDGEQIVVLTTGAAPAAGALPGTTARGGIVDLNAATLADLDGLPGVGPVLAQRILDWRSAHGRFGSVDELREVTGIGAARFADLKARVRV